MYGLLDHIPKSSIVGLLPPITTSTYNFLICALSNGLSVAPFPQFSINPLEEWKILSSKAKISTIIGLSNQYTQLKAISKTLGISANVILTSEIASLASFESISKAGQFYLSNLIKKEGFPKNVEKLAGNIIYYNLNRIFQTIDSKALESLEKHIISSVLNHSKITKDDVLLCCSNSHLSYILLILLNKLTGCNIRFLKLENQLDIEKHVKIKSENSDSFHVWQTMNEIDGNIVLILDNTLLNGLEKTFNSNFAETARKVVCILNADNLCHHNDIPENIFPSAIAPNLQEFPLFDRDPMFIGPFKTPYPRRRDLMKARAEGYVKRVPIQGRRWGNFTGRNKNWTLLFK